jgi:hypothetical protein
MTDRRTNPFSSLESFALLSQMMHSINSSAQDLQAKRDAKAKDAARIASKRYTPLMVAIKARRPTTEIECLVDQLKGDAASLDARDYRSRSAIFLATNMRQFDAVIALHAAGAVIHDPSWPDGTGVLHLLAKGGYSEVMNELLRRHFDRGGSDAVMAALTTLDHARRDPVEEGVIEAKHGGFVVDMAHKWGYDVCRKSLHGWTLLHHATRAGKVHAASALLDLGADANARKEDGFTPFYLAVINRRVDMVRLFMQRGVDPRAVAVGRKNATPLDKARRRIAKQSTASLNTDIVRIIEWGLQDRARAQRASLDIEEVREQRAFGATMDSVD